jgi:PPE-repeat protein
MPIDFGAIPPEITSALLHAGPGPASLTTAASAWNALAAELNSAALGYDSVVPQLAGNERLGPASASMAAAVQPYVEWMNTASIAAEHAATLAQAAAGAFETALASVVPPPLIAVNRAELAAATQANVFGQHSEHIAKLESQYSEFWAQDSSAMYNYASQCATATEVTQFTTAPAVANPADSATQAAAATASPAASIQRQLQLFISQISSQLRLIAQPVVGPNSNINSALPEIWFLLTGVTELPANLGALVTPFDSTFFSNTEGLPFCSVGMGNVGVRIAQGAFALGGATEPAVHVPANMPAFGGGARVAGSVGTAGSVGSKLSVPAAWSGANPAPATDPASASRRLHVSTT